MRITDELILSVIEELGALTSAQVARILVNRDPADKARIYNNVPHKTRQLAVYGFLDTQIYQGKTYYYIAGQGPTEPRPDHKASPCDKIRAYVQALPEGSTFNYSDLRAKFNVCRDVPIRALKGLSCIHRKNTKPAVFIKGAGE